MVLQDWASVLAFIEKSVMSLWSEEIKRGKIVDFFLSILLGSVLGRSSFTCHCLSFSPGISHYYEADQIRKDGIKNVVEKASSVERGFSLPFVYSLANSH